MLVIGYLGDDYRSMEHIKTPQSPPFKRTRGIKHSCLPECPDKLSLALSRRWISIPPAK